LAIVVAKNIWICRSDIVTLSAFE